MIIVKFSFLILLTLSIIILTTFINIVKFDFLSFYCVLLHIIKYTLVTIIFKHIEYLFFNIIYDLQIFSLIKLK